MSKYIPVIVLGYFDLLALGVEHLELTLATARASATKTGEMLVGIDAQEEQAIDFAAFQSLVVLKLLGEVGLVLAPVLRFQALGDIAEELMVDRVLEATEVAPAPSAFGLLGQVQVAANAHDHSEHQAQHQG